MRSFLRLEQPKADHRVQAGQGLRRLAALRARHKVCRGSPGEPQAAGRTAYVGHRQPFLIRWLASVSRETVTTVGSFSAGCPRECADIGFVAVATAQPPICPSVRSVAREARRARGSLSARLTLAHSDRCTRNCSRWARAPSDLRLRNAETCHKDYRGRHGRGRDQRAGNSAVASPRLRRCGDRAGGDPCRGQPTSKPSSTGSSPTPASPRLPHRRRSGVAFTAHASTPAARQSLRRRCASCSQRTRSTDCTCPVEVDVSLTLLALEGVVLNLKYRLQATIETFFVEDPYRGLTRLKSSSRSEAQPSGPPDCASR